MDFFVLFIAASFASAYLMSVLLWHEEGTYGPFPDPKRDVVRLRSVLEDSITEYRAQVVTFDWVRRVFGLYDVSSYQDTEGNKKEIWLVREKRLPVWACPRCLSFWTGLVVTLPAALSIPLWWVPIYVLGTAGASYAIYWWVQNQTEMSYSYSQNDNGYEDGAAHESRTD